MIFLKWTKKFLLLSLLGIISMISINYILDPFQQYRKANFYKPMFDNERYMNPGLTKTYTFTDVIIGSSMTENFILSDAKNILKFENPIKLCMSGISAHETNIMLGTAFKNNKNIRNVLYGIDFFSFYGKPSRLFNGDGSLPLYLYDDTFLNDYQYLLNIDTTKYFLNSLIEKRMSKHTQKFDFNRMYQWQHTNNITDFKEEKLLKMWANSKFRKEKYFIFDEMKLSFDINIISLIKNNPNINFYIYYPPYSVLAYKKIELENQLDEILAFKSYVYNQLKQFKNVKLYDFQVAKNITYNLDNYKDFNHHHQKINTWVLEQIKDSNYLISNNEDYNNQIKSFLFDIKNYKIKNYHK